MEVLFPVTGRAVASVVYASERRAPMPEVRRGSRPEEAFRAGVEAELENVHRIARETLDFKRKDIVVETPGPSTGALKTPRFEYRVEADVDAEDPDVAVWRRELALEGPGDPAAILAAFGDRLDTVLVRFAESLDVASVVDRLEARDEHGVQLDYDMRCRWCEVTVAGVPATVRLEGREMRVVPNAGTTVPVSELWGWVSTGALSG